MMIHEITEQAGRYKRRKRIGRGPGSGTGKTSGRGHKGYGSRSGNTAPHEGGRIPMFKRFPKRGFSNANFMQRFALVNLKAIDARFNAGETVDADALAKVGLIRDTKLPVKVLGEGELTKGVTVVAAAFSKSASEKIGNAGGKAEIAARPQKSAKAAKAGPAPEQADA